MRHAGSLRLIIVLSLAAVPLSSCSTGSQPSATPNAAARELVKADDGYVMASRFGDIVFTSGFLGVAPGDDFAADVADALDRVETALEASGAGFDTLLKMNVYLTDWDNWETFDAIYNDRIEQFGLPPRTTLEVSQLGLDAPIEIGAIAYVRTSP
jgi:enamine deaminase RidA (YjgF/YER057c/UK114 family)